MNLKLYLLHQREEIEKFKWIRSQQAGYDVGEEAVVEWVQKFAAQYRASYEEVYQEVLQNVQNNIKKDHFPGISDEAWELICEQIIDSFLKQWLKDSVCQNDTVRRHLDEL